MPSTGSWQDLKDHCREAGDVSFADVIREDDERMRDELSNGLSVFLVFMKIFRLSRFLVVKQKIV